MDTSGKDGTIRKVLADMDPPGVQVWSFRVPTEEERAHDFLWRHHLHTPPLSMVAVFNRSYYEAVVVELVKGIASPEVVQSRYPHINDFEQLLTQSQTIVAKFFLHIDEETQKERLLARQAEVEKWWKLSVGDWEERKRWDEYMAAYEAAIAATATPWAPWYVVPADRKWYRDLAVAQALVEMLRPHKEEWLAALEARGRGGAGGAAPGGVRATRGRIARRHVVSPRGTRGLVSDGIIFSDGTVSRKTEIPPSSE